MTKQEALEKIEEIHNNFLNSINQKSITKKSNDSKKTK